MAKRRRRYRSFNNDKNALTIELNHDIYLALKPQNDDDGNPFNFEDFQIEEDDYANVWEDDVATSFDTVIYFDLTKIEPKKLNVLKDALYNLPPKTLIHGTKSTITKYIAIQQGKTVRASGAKQMQMLLTNHIALNAERFWIVESENGQNYYYQVTGVTFCPEYRDCLLYTSPSPRDRQKSRMPSSA